MVDVLLGLQWGDEGKGKIVDVLAPHYDVIARFQGGPNAGHTLEFNGIRHVLHTIPSGIFHPQIINVVGNGVVIDPIVFKKEIEALRELKADTKNLSQHLNISEEDFKKKYVETSAEGEHVFNAIPCHFLHENKCTVYEARPHDCREFPHLHKPGFVFRLFSMIDNYGRCPIVFNVMEALKKSLRFI